MSEPPAVAPRRRGARAAGPIAPAALALLGAGLAMELWKANLGVPLRYTQIDDTKFYFMLVKGILEHGWYLTNGDLGAPFGQQIYDFPQGADNLNFLVIKLLGLFSSNWALVTNLFFLLTFPLTGLAAYYALRRLDVSRAASTVAAVLFALLPYHFYRHESQVLLSAYYSVPLSSYLFISLVSGRPLFAGDADRSPGVGRGVPGRAVATIATCIVVGSAGLYYAGFALVLLAAGMIVAGLGGRGRRAIRTGLAVCLVIGATLTLNLVPSIVYGTEHGKNTQIVRTPIESQQLGLRLANLVLPVLGDRIPGLGKVSGKYAAATSPGYCESCNASLGVVGAGGFLLLCLVGLAALVGVGVAGGPGDGGEGWQGRFRPAALGVGVAFGIGTVGGLSALIAYFVTPDLRGWNRLSLFIAFFSLLAVGMVLDGARDRLRARADARAAGAAPGSRRAGWRAAVGWGALLVVVLVLGATDETSNFYLVSYSAAAREYDSDQALGRQIEGVLPRGSSILELPYVPFPEGYHVAGIPTTPFSGFATSYELLRPYLNTTGLKFSFAAVKGRPADWEAGLSTEPLNVAVAAASAAGFSGIYVDPRGYGPQASRVEAWLRQLTGVAPLVSTLKNAWFFDLRPYSRRLRAAVAPAVVSRLRQSTLHPKLATCGPGPAELELTNPGSRPAAAVLSATLQNSLPGHVKVVVALPDGATEHLTVGSDLVTVLERRLVLAPGRSKVTFSTIATQKRKQGPAVNLAVGDAALSDPALAPIARFGAIAGRTPPPAGLIAPSCSIQYEATVPPL
jgi:phosphoglycerol transferase